MCFNCLSLLDAQLDQQYFRLGGFKKILSLERTPLYCAGDNTTTKGFFRSYRNLYFYWILGAGHYVSSHISNKNNFYHLLKLIKLFSVNYEHMNTTHLVAANSI